MSKKTEDGVAPSLVKIGELRTKLASGTASFSRRNKRCSCDADAAAPQILSALRPNGAPYRAVSGTASSSLGRLISTSRSGAATSGMAHDATKRLSNSTTIFVGLLSPPKTSPVQGHPLLRQL